MTTAPATVQSLDQNRSSSFAWLHTIIRFARKKPIGGFGAALLIFMALLGLLAPVLVPYPPLEFHTSNTLEPPSREFLLGTDDKGRDILSRIMYGARISMQVGAIAVGIGVTFGLIVGLVTAYVGGGLDMFAQRAVDSFQAFPALLLALAITTALGRSVWNVGIALAIVSWPTASRVVRSSVLAHKRSMYVEAARCVGVTTPRILFRHILPNVASIYIILATAGLGQAILVEASLSFLGFGIPPPEPSWGGMLNDAQRYALRAPWYAIFPGIAISIAVFGFNLFGDALRDYLDPRLRGTR